MVEVVQKAPVTYVPNQNGGDRSLTAHMEHNMLNSDDLAKDSSNMSGDKHNHHEKINNEKLSEELNKISKSLDVEVKFAYNDKIEEMYISVIDKHSGKVIRKLPSEEAMKIKETMKDFIGSLFDMKG